MSGRHDLRERLLLPVGLPLAAFAFVGAVAFGLSRILLAVSPTGAVVVAVVTAAAILGLAGLIAAAPKVNLGQLATMLGAVAGISLIAGGVVSATLVEVEPPPDGGQGPPPVLITAPEGAALDGFGTTEVDAPAGVEFVIDFENADPSVQHNVAILPEGGGGPALFSGEIVTGPIRTEYAVPALEAGPYAFICEVHPTTMTGTLTAREGGPGGGPGASIAAPSGAAVEGFSATQLTVPGGGEVSIDFDNQDVGVQHNFAVYAEQGGEAIFNGEIVTGPQRITYTFEAPEPGEYYFQCDIHPPTMNGTLIVEGG